MVSEVPCGEPPVGAASVSPCRLKQVWFLAAAVLMVAVLCGCFQARAPEDYIEELASADEQRRKRAINELTRMREDALPAVMQALETSSETEAGAKRLTGVIAVLSKSRNLESLEAIGSKTNDPNAAVRVAAIKAVAQLTGVRKGTSIELLDDAMSDTDPECVREAALGLMNMDFEDATAVLEKHLQPRRGMEAVFAAEALYRLDRRTDAATFILASISAADSDVRAAAQWVAVELYDGFIAPLVQHGLNHPDVEEVDVVLGRVRDKLFEELGKTLPARRRREVLAALGQVADQQSAERLVEITVSQKADAFARVSAAGALGEAASSERPAGVQQKLRTSIIRALKTVLHNEDEKHRVRIACAISLCRVWETDGITYLLDQLESLEVSEGAEQGDDRKLKKEEIREIMELRIRAQEGLTSSGEFVVPYLIGAIKDPRAGEVTCWAAARTLGELRVKEAVPHLGRLLTATVAPRDVEPRRGDPTGEFPLEADEWPKREPATPAEATAAQLTSLSLVVGTLVSFFVIGGLSLLILRLKGRAELGWRAALPAGIILALLSYWIGASYSHRVRARYEAEAPTFKPTRRTVLEHIFDGGAVVPARGPAVRMAAATGLGQIGGTEAAALLRRAEAIHENLRVQMQPFAARRAYLKLVPEELTDPKQRVQAREILGELARRILREQEAVRFYLRQALAESAVKP